MNQVALNSQRLMLAAADVDTEGPLGTVKLQGAVIVWARTLDVWFRDDDPGWRAPWPRSTGSCARGGRILQGLGDIYRTLTTPFRTLFDAAAAKRPTLSGARAGWTKPPRWRRRGSCASGVRE
jgi:hypothetical protein